MSEIGSEFWDVPTCEKKNQLFPESTQWFLSGRSALKAIICELGEVKSVSLPSWCCDSMIKPFADAGFTISFYQVLAEDGIVQEVKTNSDVLFLMDYFGYSAPTPNISEYKGIVIRDVSHTIFSTSYSDADYYFGSLRKWCGVWTGGYAWTRDGHMLPMEQNDDLGYISFREKAMCLKNSYIHGWGVKSKEYLKLFDEAEKTLVRVGVAPAADRDVHLIQQLDVELICSRHRKNAKVLMEALPNWIIFPEMKTTDCPMFVPVIVPAGRRNELRRFLIDNNIYCPVHWPISVYHKPTEIDQFLNDNELSLVCDQRYTEENMYQMIQMIEFFMGE